MRPVSASNILSTSLLCTGLLFSSATWAAPPPSKAACNAALQAALVSDLNFGDYEGAIGGTVIVDTADTRTSTGPVLLGGTVASAAFDVWNNLSGCERRNITVTVPGSVTLTGPASMTATVLTTNPPNKFKLTAPGVPTRVTVGATLNSAAGQATGAYTGPFNVQFDH